jgi:hypothetical protein
MRWQRDDASAGLIWNSEKTAVWIYGISGGVKTVCHLYRIENLVPVAVNCGPD